MGAKINLSHVTLCAVDCLNPMLAQRALLHSARECDFADVVLFSDSSVPRDVRHVEIASIDSKHAYSRFMLKELHRHIQTPWVLVVQWDGFVANPRAWRDAFFDYDYIGAPWPQHMAEAYAVGNGGFSLRSKRLLDLLATDEFPDIENAPEDDVICRHHREALETRHAIRFAPVDVARSFAYEYESPEVPTFGFHGAHNLWRHLDDQAMFHLLDTLHPRAVRSIDMLRLLRNYCELRKFDCARALYWRLREVLSHDEMVHFLKLDGAPDWIVPRALEVAQLLAAPEAFA